MVKHNENKDDLYQRPPIVVVLGHIDHGKSSLLEAIRDFKITAKESGGITQHVGAYQIEESKLSSSSVAGARETEGQGNKITFLDTPGHEAFSQMRSRGAKVADVAILVVDASEGVKSQTKEAIFHIKEAGLPTIVVLNKIDKPEANPEKVKRELYQEDFLVESLGGKIPCLEVSTKTKKGIPELLELILLVAEMEELKSDPCSSGQGVVVESHLDNLRGFTATLLLTDGHLKIGDAVGTNSAFVKIKGLENFKRTGLTRAFASDPVIIFGFNQSPGVGEEFKVFPDLANAEANTKVQSKKNENNKAPEILEVNQGQKVLNLILKTDVSGSIEAIEGILKSLPQEKIILRILKSAAGSINESDIKLALGSGAVIFGFRVKIDATAQKMTARERVRVMIFEVIYDLVEGVRKIMEKTLEPEDFRVDLGKVRVLAKFLTEKNRQIIGGRVIQGEIKKGTLIEVFRGEEKVGQGKMINLQRNKKEAVSISKGEECGILFEGDVSIEQGDILVFYLKEKRKGQL